MLKSDMQDFENPNTMNLTDAMVEFNNGEYNIKLDVSNMIVINDALFLTRWNINEKRIRIGIGYLNNKTDEMEVGFPTTYNSKHEKKDKSKQTLNPEVLVPYHQNSHFEICYVVSGKLKIKIENSIHIYEAGTAILLDTGLLHAEFVPFSDNEYIFLGINHELLRYILYPMDTKSTFCQFMQLALVDKKDKGTVLSIDLKDKRKLFERLLADLYSELKEKTDGYDYLAVGYYKRALKILGSFDQAHRSFERDKNKQLLFHQVTLLIDEKYDVITLEDLKEEFNYSEDYFNRLIRDVSGATYSEYLKEVRINKAIELLINSELPVEKIARLVGYSNQQFFYKVFKSKLNITPSEYRKQKALLLQP